MDGGSANTERVYTAFFPFCGIGAGALGFLNANVRLFGAGARFKVLGGIDLDPLACKGFEYLTGTKGLCADIAALTPETLRAYAGGASPDVVFLSPPCKSFSQLTSKRARRLRKYRLMNLLALQWVKLMLATWPKGPRLVLLENVPGIAKLGSALLRKIRRLLRAAGYVVSPGETHDCGELGALAQHRRRYLLVARHQESVPVLLYQPVRKKVRACGEVLGALPLPGDPSAGPLHQLPRISLLNWWRLSLIPPGGDWQDLPGMEHRASKGHKAKPVQGAGRRFNNVFCVSPWDVPTGAVTAGAGPSSGRWSVADPRLGVPCFVDGYGVAGWGDTLGAITAGAGSPTTGRFAVADPRAATRYGMNQRVGAWADPAWCVTGATDVQAGAPSVADPRVRTDAFRESYGVLGWDEPSGTVKGQAWVTTGRTSVADPRLGALNPNRHTAKFAVSAWGEPARTVTGTDTRVGSGAPCVADLRLNSRQPHTYGVLAWGAAAHTVAGASLPGNGPFSVADPRVRCRARNGFYGVVAWESPATTVTGSLQVDNGPAAVADPRPRGADGLRVVWYTRSLKDRPGFPLFLATEDGTWHRPLTTLELAALQGIPTQVNGKPLALAGSAAKVREHIGNAVPVGAAEAIATEMLKTLVGADLEKFALSGGGAVWVREREALRATEVQ